MSNMISYIKEHAHVSFDEMAFNEVDSLILSQLSYLVIGNYVSGWHKFNVTVRDIALLQDNSISQNTTLPKENKLLLATAGRSIRFGKLSLACYSAKTDEDSEQQFAAVTFRIHPRLHYIAFRGTDTSLVGWKEDLNLSFSKNIPSQHLAAQYLKRTARFLRGDLLVGGHSKGGNLAVYASMHAPQGIKKRIQTIYNHDGPGFLPEVFEDGAFLTIRDRIRKTIPHSAIVGLLLETHEPYTVVASKYMSLLQHNPFTWTVQSKDFIRLEKVDLFSRFTNQTLNDWLAHMDTESRKTFVDTLFDILKATHASTYPELFSSIKLGIGPMREKLKQLDPQTRAMMHNALRLLLKSGKEQMKLLLKKGGNLHD